MFQHTRTSAKAVLLAAGAAGFVAVGASSASADVTEPVDQVQRGATVGQVAHTLPAPGADTPQVRGPVHQALNSLPAQHLRAGTVGTAHQTANTAMNSADQVNRLSGELPTQPPNGDTVLPDVDGTVGGVPVTLLPQAVEQGEHTVRQTAENPGETPDELEGALPDPEGATDQAVDDTSGAAEDTVDQLAGQAPADAPGVPDDATSPDTSEVTEPVTDVAETAGDADTGAVKDTTKDTQDTVEDADPADDLDVDTPVL